MEKILQSKKVSDCVTDILEVANNSKLKGSLGAEKFMWHIKDGEQVLFWEDSWHSEGTLMSLYPRLYALSKLKHVNVRAFKVLIDCYPIQGEVFWNRKLRNWEVELVNNLMAVCSQITLQIGSDKLTWMPVNKEYTAANGYDLMEEDSMMEGRWMFLWKFKVPPKVLVFLWKYFQKILPTCSFLANRIRSGTTISNLCRWCNSEEESQTHLFWKCELASWAWNFVSKWWNVKIQDCHNFHSNSISKSPSIRTAWEVTWAATLWTIWLCRNQAVFQGLKIHKTSLTSLIVYRSQMWCQAANLIDNSNIWSSNPMGLVLSSSKLRKRMLIASDAKLTGFIDGSWKMIGNAEIRAGIGGYVTDSDGNLVLIFSGPSTATSPLQCELEALLYAVKQLMSSQWKSSQGVIYTDSSELINEIQKTKFSIEHTSDNDIKKILMNTNLAFKKVERLLNCEADDLAKQGASRNKLIFAWC